MLGLKLNDDLLKLVKNKRVVVVGPAPYLLGRNMGTVIDDYDIVIRINDIIPPMDIRKDYGTRTDILFHNLGTPWMPELRGKIRNNKDHFNNLKMTICPVIKSDHSETNFLSWADHYVSNVVRNFEQVNAPRMPFYWIGVRDYKNIYNEVKVQFNSGFGAIIMLLEYPLKELFITGFTLYQGGSKYEDQYYKDFMDEENIKGKSFGPNAGHGGFAVKKQFEYFKILLQKHNFKIDSHLEKILNIRAKNVYNI
jgi:hypothetical protein